MAKQLLFSLTKKDFEVEFFCAGGHGGQNMQKNATACRITHPVTKAVGISRDERSQLQNKKKAFERLINTDKFKHWHKVQTAKILGSICDIDKWVENMMNIKNMRFEIKVEGKWVVVDVENIPKDYDKLEE